MKFSELENKLVVDKNGEKIYEVDEKPTYLRTVSTKILIEQKFDLQKELIEIDRRTLHEKAGVQFAINGINTIIEMITDEEKVKEVKI